MIPQNTELIILAVILFLYSVFFLIIGCLLRHHRIDIGYRYFFAPLVPSVLLILLETLRIFVLFSEKTQLARDLGIASEYIRLVCGWSWIYFSDKHYCLNKLPVSLRKYTIVSATLIPLNMLVLSAHYVFLSHSNILASLSSLILNSCLFVAAFFALYALKYNNNLYRSTWAGITCALISLVAYPFIIITELFNFPYEFLDTDWPVWFQMHPYYALLILFVLISFTLASVLNGSEPEKVQTTTLSNREQAVSALILEGFANKDIAENLYISIPTVKTHVSNILKKEGVHDRKEYVRKKMGRSC